ncbi:MAG: glutamate-5-semialdehyde dehydrogenase, partial [Verrucomicrobiales bacterium]
MTSQEIEEQIYEMGAKARRAAHVLATLEEGKKNDILRSMAAELRSQAAEIIAENAKDLAAGEEKGLSKALLDRLRL